MKAVPPRMTPRERLLLAAAVAMAVVWAMAVLLWQPLLAQRSALTADLARTGQLLTRALRLPSAGVAAPLAADDRPVSVIATPAAAEMGLTVRRLEPQGQAVQVTLEDAPFDLVLPWVAALEGDHGLRLTGLTLTRRPAPGTVSTVLTLERP